MHARVHLLANYGFSVVNRQLLDFLPPPTGVCAIALSPNRRLRRRSQSQSWHACYPVLPPLPPPPPPMTHTGLRCCASVGAAKAPSLGACVIRGASRLYNPSSAARLGHPLCCLATAHVLVHLERCRLALAAAVPQPACTALHRRQARLAAARRVEAARVGAAGGLAQRRPVRKLKQGIVGARRKWHAGSGLQVVGHQALHHGTVLGLLFRDAHARLQANSAG
jgi:hypothetical protein